MYLRFRDGLKLVGWMALIAAIVVLVTWLASAKPLRLLVLHDADGREIIINATEITTLRRRGTGSNFPEELQCMVNFTDGKFAAVTESCETVRKLSEKAGSPPR
jgi:hypothetical protein